MIPHWHADIALGLICFAAGFLFCVILVVTEDLECTRRIEDEEHMTRAEIENKPVVQVKFG